MPKPQRLETAGVSAGMQLQHVIYWEYSVSTRLHVLWAVTRVCKDGSTREHRIWSTANLIDAHRMHDYLERSYPAHYHEISFQTANRVCKSYTSQEFNQPAGFVYFTAAIDNLRGLFWVYSLHFEKSVGETVFDLYSFTPKPGQRHEWKTFQKDDSHVIRLTTLKDAYQIHEYLVNNYPERLYSVPSWRGVANLHHKMTGEILRRDDES